MFRTLKTVFGFDALNPTTLFNPFMGEYYGSFKQDPIKKIKSAFKRKVWGSFFVNCRYEFILRPYYARKFPEPQTYLLREVKSLGLSMERLKNEQKQSRNQMKYYIDVSPN